MQPNFRLLPKLIDDLAHERPGQIVVAVPLGHEVSDGFRDVTAREFARAVDSLAWLIVEKLGRSDKFETLTYLGPTDIRYPLFALAASKAGYKSFWTSPRNSFEAHKSLMGATECRVIFTPAHIPSGITPVIDAMGLRHIEMPSVEFLLDRKQQVNPFPFTTTYEEGKGQPFTVIHTSGSTGIPKPIFLPHLLFCIPQVYATVPREDGKVSIFHWVSQNSSRTFCSFPMFHGAGLFIFFGLGFNWNTVVVMPPPQPLTAELAHEVHCSNIVDSTYLPPSIIEEIAKVPAYCDGLQQLKFTMYAGAALPSWAGDTLKSRTRLINMMGQTETGIAYQLLVDPEDYEYICPGRNSGAEFRHCYDDLYELVMVRKPGLEDWQLAFKTFPDLQELSTNDLFRQHPDPAKSNLWKHQGRKDDVIVFDNGEKLNPVTMEKIIQSHPAVQIAIVIGHGRFQSAVLIEPRDLKLGSVENSPAFIEEIWPTIETANLDCPAHGRLDKGMIIVARPDKPFPRTPKGGRTRMWTEKLYADEINEKYESAENSASNEGPIMDLRGPSGEAKTLLKEILFSINRVESLDDEADLFEAGMDSLQTLQLTRKLKDALRNEPGVASQITPSLIYHNPTVERVLGALISLAKDTGHVNGTIKSRTNALESSIQSVLSSRDFGGKKKGSETKKVLLTGSTGNLGAYLFSNLINDFSVSHIYCLNRSPDVAKRQASINREAGLVSEFDPSRVTFVQWNASKPALGISKAMHEELVRETTDIIHNAWTVDFNRSLDSYLLTDLPGLLNLATIAADSDNNVRFYFVSSIGTMMDWGKAGHSAPVPEIVSNCPVSVQPVGYAESKYVAERVLQDISSKSSIDVSILRVGQIAGPVMSEKGSWNSKEWFPSIIGSAKAMKLLPNRLGPAPQIDWIPVDILSGTIVDILNQPRGSRSNVSVYNLINPCQTSWNQLYPTVKAYLDRSGEPVEVVEYDRWLASLQKYAANARTEEDLSRNPAVKLLEFFQAREGGQSMRFSTSNVDNASVTFRRCTAVTPQWMRTWMEQWDRN
ncbi:hypothetical protein BKA56DRAFT_625196 [Ilyonectria sp. MPI-CAGE-AT-0026]|nr:hypothetical protein BKA56DRAFT_625196 [Ilyonectria sp. MPI-CAGE-AT-0026]